MFGQIGEKTVEIGGKNRYFLKKEPGQPHCIQVPIQAPAELVQYPFHTFPASVAV